jgi:ribosomal protein S27E
MGTHLDGNVLGGALGELFAVDLTAAVGQCASCGSRRAVAQAVVFADGPGLVARCPVCSDVLLRVASGEGRIWLDLRGLSCLEVASPG